jgi:cold shock CspA family protein
MLWFNRVKKFGFIQTEDDERLLVEEDGFLPTQVPTGRCAGSAVTFERATDGDEPRAINVTFVERVDPRRARLRRSR